jgi:hypothetical protein
MQVPHGMMEFRRFVLEPACEIAADWIHPRYGLSLSDLLAHLNTSPRRIAIVGAANFERVQTEILHVYPTWEVVPTWKKSEPYRMVVLTSSPVDGDTLSQYAKRREPPLPPLLPLPCCDEQMLLQVVMAAIAAME